MSDGCGRLCVCVCVCHVRVRFCVRSVARISFMRTGFAIRAVLEIEQFIPYATLTTVYARYVLWEHSHHAFLLKHSIHLNFERVYEEKTTRQCVIPTPISSKRERLCRVQNR